MATIDVASRPTALAILNKVPKLVASEVELSSISQKINSISTQIDSSSIIKSIQYGEIHISTTSNPGAARSGYVSATINRVKRDNSVIRTGYFLTSDRSLVTSIGFKPVSAVNVTQSIFNVFHIPGGVCTISNPSGSSVSDILKEAQLYPITFNPASDDFNYSEEVRMLLDNFILNIYTNYVFYYQVIEFNA